MPPATRYGAEVLTDVCAALAQSRARDAANILLTEYRHAPNLNAGRRYSPREMISIFCRDGFVDRYSGKRLVFPGTLRLIHKFLPDEFPFHQNWKTEACHFAFYELCPTLDHVMPVSRGGEDSASNWVTTSMMLNAAKANFTLEELEWRLRPAGAIEAWDGLLGWFLSCVRADAGLLSDGYIRRWYAAALRSGP